MTLKTQGQYSGEYQYLTVGIKILAKRHNTGSNLGLLYIMSSSPVQPLLYLIHVYCLLNHELSILNDYMYFEAQNRFKTKIAF